MQQKALPTMSFLATPSRCRDSCRACPALPVIWSAHLVMFLRCTFCCIPPPPQVTNQSDKTCIFGTLYILTHRRNMSHANQIRQICTSRLISGFSSFGRMWAIYSIPSHLIAYFEDGYGFVITRFTRSFLEIGCVFSELTRT